MASAPSTSLAAVANGPLFRNDPLITALLNEADQLPGAVFGIVDFSNGTIIYMGNRFADWTGLDTADLVAGGMRKVVSIVKPVQIIHLALLHGAFIQQARSEDFDPRSVRYLDLAWTAVTPKGAVPLLSSAVVLSYTPKGQFASTMAFEVKDQEGSLEVMTNCRRILRLIKERHNEIYQHEAVRPGTNPIPMQIANPILEKVTEREIDVLKLLAQGFSTTEIATQLGITANTIETHRKKLLEKFEAKNVAELIKKASRVYWLE
jgi:DNA-binding CsgD family transcriptional regulator